MREDVRIEGGDYVLALRPGCGGAVTRLTWRGEDVLRPAAADATAPTDMAMFPIAPYVNRIAFGRFALDGRVVELKPNFGDHPHALHGHAWQSPWVVETQRTASVRIRFYYAGGDWPWAYTCWQEMALKQDGAHFRITLQNASDEPMPAGIGLHPYFPRRTATTLTARVEQMWAVDDTILPTSLGAPLIDLSAGAELARASFIDNTFTQWDGQALLQTPARSVALHGSPSFGFFHLYAPIDADYFCAEPVSAAPDALNRRNLPGIGLHMLAPGETLTASMRIAVVSP